MIYPPAISKILTEIQHAEAAGANAGGSDANFGCGCIVRFRLQIDVSRMTVTEASFASNGCGYMVAAAEVLARYLSGKKLADLHGLDREELEAVSIVDLGGIAADRETCVDATAAAVRNAFADFRSRQIEEFLGEKALICTCFGVTEEAIDDAIRTRSTVTMDEVARSTNAGNGCGSCRMLIQEMLDSAN